MLGFIAWIFPLGVLILLGALVYFQIWILEELRALRREIGQEEPDNLATDE